MKILAIDPGPAQSAYVVYDGTTVHGKAICGNYAILDRLAGTDCDEIVIEMIASYGMSVGRDVFETCVWIGRFMQCCYQPVHRIPRREIKLHLCGSSRAKDPNVRQALIDRFGPGKEKAIGTKKSPGPLYGVKKDMWAALAVAVTWMDLHKEGR